MSTFPYRYSSRFISINDIEHYLIDIDIFPI